MPIRRIRPRSRQSRPKKFGEKTPWGGFFVALNGREWVGNFVPTPAELPLPVLSGLVGAGRNFLAAHPFKVPCYKPARMKKYRPCPMGAKVSSSTNHNILLGKFSMPIRQVYNKPTCKTLGLFSCESSFPPRIFWWRGSARSPRGAGLGKKNDRPNFWLPQPSLARTKSFSFCPVWLGKPRTPARPAGQTRVRK